MAPDWLCAKTENEIRVQKQYATLERSLTAIKTGDQTKQKLAAEKLAAACELSFNNTTADTPNKRVWGMIETLEKPVYLIEKLFKKGLTYSITGFTGSGKTAIALCLAKAVAEGACLGDRKVQQGHVHYLAGESPQDVLERCKASISSDIDMTIFAKAGREQAEASIRCLIKDGRSVDLVVVDTSSSYFFGDDENSNRQAYDQALWLKSISQRVPGHPTVLVLCHPALSAKSTGELVPTRRRSIPQ